MVRALARRFIQVRTVSVEEICRRARALMEACEFLEANVQLSGDRQPILMLEEGIETLRREAAALDSAGLGANILSACANVSASCEAVISYFAAREKLIRRTKSWPGIALFAEEMIREFDNALRPALLGLLEAREGE